MKIEYTLKTGVKLVLGERRGQLDYRRGAALEYVLDEYENEVFKQREFSR